MNTLRLKHVVLTGLLAAFILAPAWGSFQGRPQSNPATAQPDVLKVVPADSIFCLRIKTFEYTLTQIGQLLPSAGPLPMSIVLSGSVRTQFTRLLGDPQLPGVDMNGDFVVLAIPAAAGSNALPVGANLIPVSDYQAFLGNPNVAAPDAQGVSGITVDGSPSMVAKQAGNYALVGEAKDLDAIVALAGSMTSGTFKALAAAPGIADNEIVDAPVWFYMNWADMRQGFDQAIAQVASDPDSAQQIQMAMMVAAMAGLDIQGIIQAPVDSATIGVTPSPDVLAVAARFTPVAGSALAQKYAKGSPESLMMFQAIAAVPPAQMGAELSVVTNLLPQAGAADAVGLHADLMQFLKTFAQTCLMLPLPASENTVPKQSKIAYAIRQGDGYLSVDIAVPKEHITEIAPSFGEVAPGETPINVQDEPMQIDLSNTEDEPDDEIAKITASPFGDLPRTTVVDVQPRQVTMPVVETNTSLFGDTGLSSVANTAAPTQAADHKVRVAGVRLVRYSDLKLGVLPLGRGDGYTLSLIADLPASAVKISGGQVQKALTNNGKSLMPEDEWDRKVRFGRLSKDHKTAIFDVELLLPDQGTLGLEELAGTLEYLTATGTKDVDLSLLALKPGAKASQLDAQISSISFDPYQNNAPIVALTLNVPGDNVESIELYDKSGRILQITQYGTVTHGNAATIKFFVDGEFPAEARIVVHIFEGLQKHNLPFTIKAISIAGLPMQ